MRSSLRLPQPCDSKVTVTSQTLPSHKNCENLASLLLKAILVKVTKKSNTKPGVGGDAWVSLSEGSMYECDCVSIVVRVMRCPSSLFDA